MMATSFGWWIVPFGLAVQIPFCICFLFAWVFYLSTESKRLLWRICAAYHAAFSFVGGGWYIFGSFKRKEKPIVPLPSFTSSISTTNNSLAASTSDTADQASPGAPVRQSTTPLDQGELEQQRISRMKTHESAGDMACGWSPSPRGTDRASQAWWLASSSG
ncbi:hypothetical protein MCOR07_003989 [Pyricularia oryzae]|nr:hypothetical protein MCOR15_006596 [Pyricularia oryzae]KAI6623255.1 hypothetical protein MCOR07_003989 [Pyricularia oryzae]